MRMLRRIPEIGVNFIDTADCYGPDVSERLIREGLDPLWPRPYRHQSRSDPPWSRSWAPHGRPEYLMAEAQKSLCHLGVEPIDLWQLHRIDPGSA